MLLWQLKKFLESRKSNEIKFPFRTAGFISFCRLPKRRAYPKPLPFRTAGFISLRRLPKWWAYPKPQQSRVAGLQGVFIYLLFRASSNRHKLKTPRHLRVEAFVPRTGTAQSIVIKNIKF